LLHVREPRYELLESHLVFFIERIGLLGIYVENGKQITPFPDNGDDYLGA